MHTSDRVFTFRRRWFRCGVGQGVWDCQRLNWMLDVSRLGAFHDEDGNL
jgi:hypothetical protein